MLICIYIFVHICKKTLHKLGYTNGAPYEVLSFECIFQALQSAVNSFDVLQSICIRVEELVDKVRSNA